MVIDVTIKLQGDARLDAIRLFVPSFGGKEELTTNPNYYFTSSGLFPANDPSKIIPLPPYGLGYELYRGFSTSFRLTSIGATLAIDLTMDVFISGGNLIEVLGKILNQRITNIKLDQIARLKAVQALRNLKVDITHIKYTNKTIMDLGPSANDPSSAFECEEFGKAKITIEQYFERKAKAGVAGYRKLQYPNLPTVKINKNYYPMELVHLRSGQYNRIIKNIPQVKQKVVDTAVVSCHNRFQGILNNEFFNIITTCDEAIAFGLNGIVPQPIEITADLLPSPMIAYSKSAANNPSDCVDPQLMGSWRAKETFLQSPPVPPVASDKKYHFLPLVIGDRDTLHNQDPRWNEIDDFLGKVETQRKIPVYAIDQPLYISVTQLQTMQTKAIIDSILRKTTYSFLLIILLDNDYHDLVKQIFDVHQIITRCVKFSNIGRPIISDILDKVWIKLGGIKYGILTNAIPSVQTQSRPSPLSGILSKPTMLIGMDVTHPGREVRDSQPSVAAIVGSLDSYLCQYGGYLIKQPSAGQEMIRNLDEAIVPLLQAFKRKNNIYPKQIIVFRDGVSDGQYEQVLEQEIPQIHEALTLLGLLDTKIVVLVCTKRHSTRFAYDIANKKTTGGGESEMWNLCPGSVIDNRHGPSIVHPNFNEFYLQSHNAIKGAAKACRYTLLYDEIGVFLSEIELLTYWTTYTFVRCNRSVSYATPAYYAHLLSLRGKELMQRSRYYGASSTASVSSRSSGGRGGRGGAGGSPSASEAGGMDLQALSNIWLQSNQPMYFA